MQELIKDSDFELFVISLNLAHEDGLRLCSMLRSNEKTRSVPILMVAEEKDMDRIAQGLEIGAHDYILHPVDRNEMLARTRTQIRRKRFQDRLRANYEASLSMALTDSLTGLYNRRYLEAHLDKMIAKNAESRKGMAILALDLDHFKKINDTHGHGAGDDVLKGFADRVLNKLRSFDLVARVGGEEFIAVLPDVKDHIAMMIAERLRAGIADKKFMINNGTEELRATTSIGGVMVPFDNTEPTSALLERADKALYEAKEYARNCVYFDGVGLIDQSHFVPRQTRSVHGTGSSETE